MRAGLDPGHWREPSALGRGSEGREGAGAAQEAGPRGGDGGRHWNNWVFPLTEMGKHGRVLRTSCQGGQCGSRKDRELRDKGSPEQWGRAGGRKGSPGSGSLQVKPTELSDSSDVGERESTELRTSLRFRSESLEEWRSTPSQMRKTKAQRIK